MAVPLTNLALVAPPPPSGIAKARLNRDGSPPFFQRFRFANSLSLMARPRPPRQEAWQVRAIFVFGAFLIVVSLATAILIPHWTNDQRGVFRVAIALGGAGVAAIIPGFIEFRRKWANQVVSAGGALAVFVVIFMLNVPVAGQEGPKFAVGKYSCTVDGNVMADCVVRPGADGGRHLSFRTADDAAGKVHDRFSGTLRRDEHDCVFVTLQREFAPTSALYKRSDAGTLSVCRRQDGVWDGHWLENDADKPVTLALEGKPQQ